MSEQPIDKNEAREALIEALLGFDERHTQAYHQEIFFRHSVDMLAQLLPLWVEGLFAESGDQAEAQENAYQELVTSPAKMVVPLDQVPAGLGRPVPPGSAPGPRGREWVNEDGVVERVNQDGVYVPTDVQPGESRWVNGQWVVGGS